MHRSAVPEELCEHTDMLNWPADMKDGILGYTSLLRQKNIQRGSNRFSESFFTRCNHKTVCVSASCLCVCPGWGEAFSCDGQ